LKQYGFVWNAEWYQISLSIARLSKLTNQSNVITHDHQPEQIASPSTELLQGQIKPKEWAIINIGSGNHQSLIEL